MAATRVRVILVYLFIPLLLMDPHHLPRDEMLWVQVLSSYPHISNHEARIISHWTHFNLYFILGNISKDFLKTCFFHILHNALIWQTSWAVVIFIEFLLVIHERLKECLNYIFTGHHTFIMYTFIVSSTSFYIRNGWQYTMVDEYML